MNSSLPEKCPQCVVNVLARSEWFNNPEIVGKTRLAEAKGLSRLLSSKLLARQTIGAIALGSTIYFRELDQYNPHTIDGLAFLAHELKHVEQYRREGMLKFFAKYIKDYIRHGGYGDKLTFEAEASEFQRQVKAHLTREFGNNPGHQLCKEMGAPHTPNEHFAKGIPIVFKFPGTTGEWSV